MPTTLTEEQRQRIEQNRLRALEIQRQRRLQQEKEQQQLLQQQQQQKQRGNEQRKPPPPDDVRNENGKRSKTEPNDENNSNRKDGTNNNSNKKQEDDEEELEDFEQGASELVTKREAMQMYCLPEGTLAVCTFVEKDNPHRKGWTPMKLYHRHEIRKRARKRFGGLEGLIEERRKRQERQFQKDMERSKQIFQTKNAATNNGRKRKM